MYSIHYTIWSVERFNKHEIERRKRPLGRVLLLIRWDSFFVDWVLAVLSPIFARCTIFRNQSSHVENRTEPASQIPEEG